jgi:hypothetical protein
MDKYGPLIQRTISNLTQIGKLNPNQKLRVDAASGYMQVDSGVLPSVMRMIQSQDRHMTYTCVEENVMLCMLLTDLLSDIGDIAKKVPADQKTDANIVRFRERENLHVRLIKALADAKSGVSSLVSTYVSDTAVSALFDGLLRKMEEFLNVH